MAAHRYWRLNYLGTQRGYCGCATLELRGVKGGPDLARSIGGGAIADDSYNNLYTPDRVFDGDPHSSWATNGGNHWVGMDFRDNPQDIVEIGFAGRYDYGTDSDSPTQGSVEYSDDGNSWTRSFLFNHPDGGYQQDVIYTFHDQGVPTYGYPHASQMAAVVPSSASPGPAAHQLALVSVANETPLPSQGGKGVALVLISVGLEYHQPTRYVPAELVCGPWAVPLWIAKGA